VKTGSASPTTLSHRMGFGALLALTMASSTFAFTAFSVLSGSLLDTFALRRWQLGALVTAAAGVGAFTSPVLGRLSDRIGGRGALQLTLGLSALVLAGIAVSPVYPLLIAVSPVYPLLIAAALASGLAQAAANPATNKLIATHVAAGVRGTVTGIKQATGLLVSAAGLCGIAGRVGWSFVAERRLGAATTLAMLAALGSAAVVAVLLAGHAPALLWIGTAVLGASSGSWNSVGMFAVIDRMPSETSGAASGVVMLGFLIGLGIGAPPFGWAVDVTGSYAPGLIAVAAVHVAGFRVARTLGEVPIVAGSGAP
jgi:predicted MFS family arabinose efflux permease